MIHVFFGLDFISVTGIRSWHRLVVLISWHLFASKFPAEAARCSLVAQYLFYCCTLAYPPDYRKQHAICRCIAIISAEVPVITNAWCDAMPSWLRKVYCGRICSMRAERYWGRENHAGSLRGVRRSPMAVDEAVWQ